MLKSTLLCSAIFFVFFFSLVSAVNYPTCVKYVTDEAGVITPEWKDKINNLANLIEQNTTNEVAVVTVKSLEGLTVEEYAVELFEQCGIGKESKDNGILILTAIEDRKWKIEVGYGLEGTINDARAGDIGRTYITAYFKQEKYGEGLYLAVDALNKYFEGDVTQTTDQTQEQIPDVWIIVIIVIAVVGVIFFVALISGSGDGGGSSSSDADDDDGYHGGSGGGGGGGGDSGGGGGFGGGGSGEGGAGGGW
jgi:uncharacterized protein